MRIKSKWRVETDTAAAQKPTCVMLYEVYRGGGGLGKPSVFCLVSTYLLKKKKKPNDEDQHRTPKASAYK